MYNTKVFNSYLEEELCDSILKLRDFYDQHYYNAAKQIAKGENLKIALLDSGIDMMHDKLGSRFIEGYNAYKETKEFLDDVDGHGTFMAGLITGRDFGLLENSELIPIRVCGDDKKMNLSSIVRGVRHAIALDVDLIVMAITTKTNYPELHEVIKMAYDKNICVICPACNDNSEIGYPAKYKETLTVSGIDYKLEKPDFALNDVAVDLVMPSVDIPSTYYYNRYAVSSGNSVATALAANYIGMIQHLRKAQHKERLTVEQLRKFIKRNSVAVPDFDAGIPTFKFFKNFEFGFDNMIKRSYSSF